MSVEVDETDQSNAYSVLHVFSLTYDILNKAL